MKKWFFAFPGFVLFAIWLYEPNLSRAGYEDGYAQGYNSRCDIRETEISGKFGNSSYLAGFADGLIAGETACLSGLHSCAWSDNQLLEVALSETENLLSYRNGKPLLEWLFGPHQIIPDFMKTSPYYSEANHSMRLLSSDCVIIAIARSVYGEARAEEISKKGPYARRALRNSLSAFFPQDASGNYIASPETAKDRFENLRVAIQNRLAVGD